jgi:hypothetical protein
MRGMQMKVGDLVQWTHPEAMDFGLILQMGEDAPERWINRDGEVLIAWVGIPAHSGFYPADHKLLELVSESR